MNSKSSIGMLTIHHEPYGENHPYEPLPWERIPRDPTAGEPIELGIITSHNPSPKSVWCTWQIEGDTSQFRNDASKFSSNESQEIWKVILPPFFGGKKVRYRLHAQGGERSVETEEFEFFVSTWVDVVSVSSFKESTGCLLANLKTQLETIDLRLEVQTDAKGTISLRFSPICTSNQKILSNTSEKLYTAKLGGIRVSLKSNPFQLSLFRESDGLILHTDRPIQVLCGIDGQVLKFQMGFETPSDEAFYGFGERFNALDQRGNHLDNYVYGQYLNQEKRSYIPIPFFLSSRVYGFWVETEQQVQFDLAADKSNSWFLIGNVGEDQSLNIRFFFQKNPHSIVKTFTDKTGKPQLPPPWVYGLWMSSNDWNNQTDVLRQLDLSKRYEIPASVMVVEAWSDEINFYIWNDAQFKHKPSSQAYSYSDFVNPKNGKWPDPKSMIDELHRSGMRLVLWQIPVMKFGNPDENLDETQKDADQEFAIKQKFIVNNTDGDPYRIEAHAPWFGNSLLFDFTNPEAEQWWFDKREYLITEMGVDGFKTDGGEHSWDAKTRFSNGLRGDRGINTYPMMYEEAYNRFLKKHRGNDYVLFSRAGYTGVQQISCHWAGDERSTWNAFRSTINAMLNVSMCGVSFIGWDIAGFAGPIPETDLYLRAVAFSVFCPIMQYHSDYNARRPPCKDRTPWNIQEQSGDQRIIPLFKRFTNLRMNLIPYILSQAQMSSMSGLPLMRALPLEYPEDINCRSHPSEYLFGDALLVSPIIEPKKTECQVYLPQGKWCDLWTGMIFEGAQEISVHAPMDTIPVFQRKGSIVLLNLNETLELCGPVGNSTEEFMNLAALVYPGKFYEIEIYQGAGRTPGRISTQLDPNDGVRVNVNNIQNGIDLFILGIEPSLVTFNGKLIPCLEQDDVFSDSHWKKRRNRSEIHVHIPKGQEVFTLFLQ